jgi:hypothetical protein
MASTFHRPAFSGPTGGALTALALLVGGGVLVFTAMRRWTVCEIR